MDIKTEREAFLDYMRSIGAARFMFELDEDGNFDDMSMSYAWSAWQAAKAQAVPEGFVLIEKTKLMQIVGSAAIIEPITRGNPLMSKYKTELDFILSTVRAMIKAQEQK